jgi:hypothetical protein
MGSFVLAWLLGTGIIVTRSVTKTHAPPVPGALLTSSGIFAILALIAESDTARPIAVALAYGFDVAALVNLWPSVTGGTPKAELLPQTFPANPGSSQAA